MFLFLFLKDAICHIHLHGDFMNQISMSHSHPQPLFLPQRINLNPPAGIVMIILLELTIFSFWTFQQPVSYTPALCTRRSLINFANVAGSFTFEPSATTA
jgi:hypothetical protein